MKIVSGFGDGIARGFTSRVTCSEVGAATQSDVATAGTDARASL